MLVSIVLLCMLVSYVVGTIPFGHFVSSIKGIDITSVGTGNPGASNVYKEVGPIYGILLFVIDISKGMVIPFIVLIFDGEIWIASLCLFSLVLGHVTPSPWKGYSGTGMAAAMGASIAMIPVGALICVPPALAILIITKNPTYTGVVAFLIAMVSDWLIMRDFVEVGTVLVCSLIILMKFSIQYRDL